MAETQHQLPKPRTVAGRQPQKGVCSPRHSRGEMFSNSALSLQVAFLWDTEMSHTTSASLNSQVQAIESVEMIGYNGLHL